MTASSAKSVSTATGAGRNVDYRGIDEAQNAVEIDRHIHLFDRIYLKLGVKYERFDFSETRRSPAPSRVYTASSGSNTSSRGNRP